MSKYVFITGVSSGIGRATMDLFHQKGFHVIGTVRSQDDVLSLLKIYPENLTLLQFDVQDSKAMTSEISKIPELLHSKTLAVLVNNAGFALPGPLELISEEDFEKQLDVNVKSVRRITNALLPYLKGVKPGKIINISSVSGILNTPFVGAYCISKHALESMNEIYRRELSIFGIKVVSVLPGPIKTQIWKKNIGKLDPYFDSPYGHILKNADKMIEKSEQNGLPVEKVTSTIWKIFETKNPKNRYIVHKHPFMIRIIAQWIPSKMLDALMAKTMRKGDEMRPI